MMVKALEGELTGCVLLVTGADAAAKVIETVVLTKGLGVRLMSVCEERPSCEDSAGKS